MLSLQITIFQGAACLMQLPSLAIVHWPAKTASFLQQAPSWTHAKQQALSQQVQMSYSAVNAGRQGAGAATADLCPFSALQTLSRQVQMSCSVVSTMCGFDP